MASHSRILQQCFQEAASGAGVAIGACIDHAVTALQLAETKVFKMAERDELHLAWRELLKCKGPWCDAWPKALLASFAAAPTESGALIPAASAAGPPAAHASSQFDLDSFSLVDDSQVSQAIESGRLLQAVLPVVEQALSQLDALMSSALGLPNVQPERNPLRPDVFVGTLRALVTQASVEPTIRSLWLRQLAPLLATELRSIYARQLELLEQAQVQAAGYRVLQTPAGTARKAASSGPSSGDRDGTGNRGHGGPGTGDGLRGDLSGGTPMSARDFDDALLHEFVAQGGARAQHGLSASYYAVIEEELAALQAVPDSGMAPLRRMAPDPSMPVVDRPAQAVDAESPLDARVWGTYGGARQRAIVRTRLKKDATRVAQVLGIEVVRKLVNQVAQDPRLLTPVREAIIALEPSLARLAMVDSRFFSDESHPGRALMERVAQRSFKYNDEFSPEFTEFFGPVTLAFNRLNALEVADAQPFVDALSDLQAGWSTIDEAESARRDDIVQTMQFAEQRQAQADQIAYDLGSRPDLEGVPGAVLDFLFGPWSLVLAHARLTDKGNQIDPGGYGSVVSDLLWSVKKEGTLRRPAKLFQMIPGLLSKLHEGLNLLGQDPRENQPFFDALERLHRPVLKLRRVKSQRDARESGAAALESAAAALEVEELAASSSRIEKVPGQVWLARDELSAAGFEDTQATQPDDLDTVTSTLATPAAAALVAADSTDAPSLHPMVADHDEPPPEQVLEGLQTGCWIDLFSRRRWLRAQLVWASAKGTLFMFVSHGGRPHSMTKRSCERLIRERLLRPVQSHGVVAHALDALAQVPLAAPGPSAPARRARNDSGQMALH